MQLQDLKEEPPLKEGELVDETIEESYVAAMQLISELVDEMTIMRGFIKRTSKTKLAKNIVLDSGCLITDASLFIDQAYGG